MPTNYLFLTGGLGNQLFQLAALNSYSENAISIIDDVNGKPRVNSKNIPDLFEFTLSEEITTTSRVMSKLTIKAVGYTLRSHLDPKGIEHNKAWRFATRMSLNLLLSLHFSRKMKVKVLRNLGDDPSFKISGNNNFLLGYFQSVRWASSLRNQHGPTLRLNKTNKVIDFYRELSVIEKPLVVHVRLGDYVSETGFGIPGSGYYRNAIESHMESGKHQTIWLFSDEPDKAISRIPEYMRNRIRVISEVNLSTAETLEIMRFGHGYVIANSSFSWWGAFLSYAENSLVTYPDPWFKDVNSPNNLTPPDWKSIDAEF